MKNTEFVDELIELATTTKTVYCSGGFGQYATDANKEYFKSHYAVNRTGSIADGITRADANTRLYDCVCLIKSVINGTGHYSTAPCPDVNINEMLKGCTEVSEDFDYIAKGEFLVFGDYSHCGIYAGEINGKRYAVECTNRWANGVQLIEIDRPERKDLWKYHGKLTRYMNYVTEQPRPAAATDAQNELKAIVTTKVIAKRGDRGDYVRAIQRVLIEKGYSCGRAGADGDFGFGTYSAVVAFQKACGISADGVVGYDTINYLLM